MFTKCGSELCERGGADRVWDGRVAQTANLDVLRLAEGGIRTEASHFLARIGEVVVSVMVGNGHRWPDGGAIVVGSPLAHCTHCGSWRGSLRDCY